MTNLSAYPIRVDGVRLDTLAYAVLEHRVQVAGARTADLVVPGADGVIPSVWDDSEPGLYGLTIMVRGRDDDGNVDPGQSEAEYQANLDEVTHLFRGSPHRTKTITRDLPGGAREVQAKVVDVITPDESNGWTSQVAVSCLLPDPYWRDAVAAEAGPLPVGTTFALAAFANATAPIHDGVFTVHGPGATPRISDPYTGAYVALDRALSTTDVWRVNSATWSSTVGPGLTTLSDDTDGLDVSDVTRYGGGSARYLTLVPERVGRSDRRIRLALSFDSGATSTSVLRARAHRKYLA